MKNDGLLLLASLLSLAAPAYGACGQEALQHERKDVATIQTLETAWSVAFLQGDTELERCLLTPDFTEILRDGSVQVLADELGFAAKNRGKNLPIPDLPKGAVLIHGVVAVAYGLSTSTGKDGKLRMTRYADYYVWEESSWHAFFAQQSELSAAGGAPSP
jgi:hypothetical protein